MVKKTFILAIDFDGTIVTLNYPKMGTLIKDADVIINQLAEDGHKIIINTCRSGEFEEAAKEFLYVNKIPYHAINENLPEVTEKYKTDCRKISADYYIDDLCIMGLPSWKNIYNIIKSKTYAQA